MNWKWNKQKLWNPVEHTSSVNSRYTGNLIRRLRIIKKFSDEA